jgi:hypothetical protein
LRRWKFIFQMEIYIYIYTHTVGGSLLFS